MSAIYSMTGFASYSDKLQDNEISCEVRSVNSRYLEIYLKVPKALSEFEDRLKEIVRQKVKRGKLNIIINFSSLTPALQNLKVDENSVLLFKNLLNQIREIAGIQDPIRLEHLLEFKEIISFEEQIEEEAEIFKALSEVLNQTLDALNVNRQSEGENLKLDIMERLKNIERLAQEIEIAGKDNAKIEFKKLYNRILSLIEEKKLEPNRLELELALISDRVDITEEIVRLKSHVQLFKENLEEGSPIGKKLNFILQEMHREANTIASKSTVLEVSHRIVEIKEEIERIREQVQNIE